MMIICKYLIDESAILFKLHFQNDFPVVVQFSPKSHSHPCNYLSASSLAPGKHQATARLIVTGELFKPFFDSSFFFSSSILVVLEN